MKQTNVIQDSSGILGIFGSEDAANSAYYGLHAMQHRGQDGVGIAVSNGETVSCSKGLGLLSETMSPASLQELKGSIAIGQVRMATIGDSQLENVQPIMVRAHQGHFAIVTSGMITNAITLRNQLEEEGLIFQGTSDAELIAHLIQIHPGKFVDKIRGVVKMIEGAYNFMIATRDSLYVMRDPYGIHPLSMGKSEHGTIFSSETCSFGILGAHFEREVNPGELLCLCPDKEESIQLVPAHKKTTCAMEYVYFSRPDSIVNTQTVHEVRTRCGEALARQEDVQADMVIGVPDTATSAAVAFARVSKMPYEIGLMKNRYIGSTFIRPTKQQRQEGMRVRLNAISSVLKGKRVILVDDSIVKGSTAKRLSVLLKEAGAKEVHLRIASPKISYPCLYGTERTRQQELAAYNYTEEEMCALFQVESIRFLSLEDFKKCIPDTSCLACFNGNYSAKLCDYIKEIKE